MLVFTIKIDVRHWFTARVLFKKGFILFITGGCLYFIFWKKNLWTLFTLHNKEMQSKSLSSSSSLYPYSGLVNYLVCKRFRVQTLLWSLVFLIEINLEHDASAASWSIWKSEMKWQCFQTNKFPQNQLQRVVITSKRLERVIKMSIKSCC